MEVVFCQVLSVSDMMVGKWVETLHEHVFDFAVITKKAPQGVFLVVQFI